MTTRVSPDPSEREALECLDERLADFVRSAGGDVPSATLVVGDDSLLVPGSALAALVEAVHALAAGKRFTMLADGEYLTTQQAAEILGVSRPFVVGLLDSGELRRHMVGKHRRVLAEDVLAYRKRRISERRAAVRALAEQALDDEPDLT